MPANKVKRPDHPVIIIGGGLAGMTAAHRLHQAGIAFHLLEARNRLGGRILSVDAMGQPGTDGFDLGPSWFWPDHQPDIANLIGSLGLRVFAQHSDGDVVFQRGAHEAPQRYQGIQRDPQSMRLAGGSAAIISALARGLPRDRVHLGTRVTHVALKGASVDVHFEDAIGPDHHIRGAQVLIALPPRLVEQSIQFTPAIDPKTRRRWSVTPTWMAPHAKFFAIYDHPFWRDAGLSGTAQSMVGPLVEVHDATTASGQAALFGFIGISAEQRTTVGQSALKAAAVEQLTMLFGEQAASPRATLLKDWSNDTLISTSEDKVSGGHPAPDRLPWVTGDWRNWMTLIGSETSPVEPGYLAGAVVAAERAVAQIKSRYEPHN